MSSGYFNDRHDFRRTAARRKYLDKDIYAAQLFLGNCYIKTTQDYIGLTDVDLSREIRNRKAGKAA